MFRTRGIENEVRAALGAELDTIVVVQFPAVDLFASHERTQAAACVHDHKVDAVGLNDSVIARDPRVGHDQVFIRLATDSERHVIERNGPLLRAVHKDQLRKWTRSRRYCGRGS